MKLKPIFRFISVIFLAVFLIVLTAGCDYFIGPEGPAGETGADGVDGATGPAGADGADGEDGGNIPGGTLTLSISYGGIATSSSIVHICFDPDIYITDDDETMLTFSIADYFGDNGVSYTVTWRAPDVMVGSYFVYTWIDFDGNSVMDTTPNDERNFVTVFDLSGTLEATSTPGEITNNTGDSILIPNYTFWDDFAPQIDLTANYSS